MNVTPSSTSTPRAARRDFLKVTTSVVLATSGILGVAGLLRFLDFDSEAPRKTEFDLGAASKYPVGSRTLLPDVPALLIRSQTGFAAMSLICSHLGCTVDEKPDGFACPCHGSRYDSEGKVLRGPAIAPLRRLRIEVTGEDHLLLHTD
jgi:cytochrome b6-f complex iron-sulfur subunit